MAQRYRRGKLELRIRRSAAERLCDRARERTRLDDDEGRTPQNDPRGTSHHQIP